MKNISEQVVIRELVEAKDIEAAHLIISQIYSEMNLENYLTHIAEMQKMNNFKMVGAFLDGKMVGVSGYWILIMLYCGKYIQVSNLVIDEKHRSLGIGKKILDFIGDIGRESECKKIILDSYTENKKSHSLYYREEFHIRGFHFMKDL